jgi:hypothetical protein
MDGVTVVPHAVVDERPVGYENAKRLSAGEWAAEKAAQRAAYSNWRGLMHEIQREFHPAGPPNGE